METLTTGKKIKYGFSEKISNIEYYCAKKGLDKNFGEREYWGSDISEMIKKQKEYIDKLKKYE